jgi:hypothetical protein
VVVRVAGAVLGKASDCVHKRLAARHDEAAEPVVVEGPAALAFCVRVRITTDFRSAGGEALDAGVKEVGGAHDVDPVPGGVVWGLVDVVHGGTAAEAPPEVHDRDAEFAREVLEALVVLGYSALEAGHVGRVGCSSDAHVARGFHRDGADLDQEGLAVAGGVADEDVGGVVGGVGGAGAIVGPVRRDHIGGSVGFAEEGRPYFLVGVVGIVRMLGHVSEGAGHVVEAAWRRSVARARWVPVPVVGGGGPGGPVRSAGARARAADVAHEEGGADLQVQGEVGPVVVCGSVGEVGAGGRY